MRMLLSAAVLTMVFLPSLLAGADRRGRAEAPPDLRITPADHLVAGRFEWQPERSQSGRLGVVVSLPRQMLYVYRGGVLIARSSVSSGRPGHSTPSGLFQILGKEVMHHSNLYDNAPMPWMQRLTMQGVALHAGYLPGAPASHGCIRLPPEFAKRLFTITSCGDPVLVAGKTDDVVQGSGEEIPPPLATAMTNMPVASLPAEVVVPDQPAPESATESAPKPSIGSFQVMAASPSPVPIRKTMIQLEDEELRIRNDPSLDRGARSKALLKVWSEQRALTGGH